MKDGHLEDEYPGIGRLHYFLAQVGMIAVAIFVVTTLGPESPAVGIMTIALMVASFVLDVMRLKNIGVSQWFAFLRYLPFGRLLLGFGLLSAQTGWVETKRFDRAGVSILIVEAMLVGLMLFMYLRMGVVIFAGY